MKQSFNIVQHFLTSANRYPENIALREGQQMISYEKLAREVKQMVNYYQSRGIKKGDRVLVFVPMSIDLYRSVLALFHIGATAVFLDEWVGKERMEYCCELTYCKAFIGNWKVQILAYFSKPLRQLPIRLKPNAFKKCSSKAVMATTRPEDAALITFTTGSTGKPKAAKRSHAFLDAQFKALCDKIQPQPGDVAMPFLPIVLLCNLGVGATSVIADYPSRKPQNFKPEKALRQIRQYGINRISSSPYFVKRLAEHCLKQNIQIPDLKQIFTGGAPVFQKEAKLYLQAFPSSNIEIVYGSTEAEPIASVNAKQLVATTETTKGLLVGDIYKHTQLKIIPVCKNPIAPTTELALDKMELTSNTIGEIIVAGDHVLKEYFRAPEAWKQNKIMAGDTLWHRTGDSGYVDENGRLFLTGPCKQLIKNEQDDYWAPFIFEGLLHKFSEISIGTLLSVGGNLVVFAEVKKAKNLDQLKKQIQAILPPSIQNIQFVDYIPRDPRHHSKIDYGKLKEGVR